MIHVSLVFFNEWEKSWIWSRNICKKYHGKNQCSENNDRLSPFLAKVKKKAIVGNSSLHVTHDDHDSRHHLD